MEKYIRKSLSRIGPVKNSEIIIACLAREVWETLVVQSLYDDGFADGDLVFKGGGALRLLYGSSRMSSDLDFNERPKIRENYDSSKETARRISLRLRKTAMLLEDFGFSNVRFSVVKEGDGTIRFKTSAQANLKDCSSISFVSKLEISKRISKGFSAIIEKYGQGVIETKEKFDIPESLSSEIPKVDKIFIQTYTPLALFLMKLHAVASSSRRTTRDIYDMAYLWNQLIPETKQESEFITDCIEIFVQHDLKPEEKRTFLTLFQEKGERFLEDIEQGGDIHFYGEPDKEEIGLFVLEFIDEFLLFLNGSPSIGFANEEGDIER